MNNTLKFIINLYIWAMKNIRNILFLSALAISSVGFASNVTTEKAEKEKVEVAQLEVNDVKNIEMEETVYEGASVLNYTIKDDSESYNKVMEAMGSSKKVLIVGDPGAGKALLEALKLTNSENDFIIIDDLDHFDKSKLDNHYDNILLNEQLLKSNETDTVKPSIIDRWDESKTLICPISNSSYSTSPKEHFGKTGIKRCRK